MNRQGFVKGLQASYRAYYVELLSKSYFQSVCPWVWGPVVNAMRKKRRLEGASTDNELGY